MACLICDLRAEAAALTQEYAALRAAGEALALFWPQSAALPAGFAAACSETAMEECFENEVIAVLCTSALPGWLRLEGFNRVLLVSASAELAPEERTLAGALLRSGCEAVEIVAPAGLADLSQSWHSGRRTGGRLLRGL